MTDAMTAEADQIEQDDEFWQAVYADLRGNGPDAVRQAFTEEGDPEIGVIAT